MTSAEHYLRKSPHYYTNINQDGEGFLYDRLWGRDTDKRPLEGVIIPIKRFQKAPPPLRMRQAQWPCRLKGDLFDILDEDERTEPFSIWQKLKELYHIIFQTVLENASR